MMMMMMMIIIIIIIIKYMYIIGKLVLCHNSKQHGP
jgi:hypothetical protein